MPLTVDEVVSALQITNAPVNLEFGQGEGAGPLNNALRFSKLRLHRCNFGIHSLIMISGYYLTNSDILQTLSSAAPHSAAEEGGTS